MGPIYHSYLGRSPNQNYTSHMSSKYPGAQLNLDYCLLQRMDDFCRSCSHLFLLNSSYLCIPRTLTLDPLSLIAIVVSLRNILRFFSFADFLYRCVSLSKGDSLISISILNGVLNALHPVDQITYYITITY